MTKHVSPADLSAYTQALALPIADKLFFTAHVPDDVSVFVDYGCADGLLLWETMKERFGLHRSADNQYIGFDHDPAMLDAAQKRVSWDPAFTFVDSHTALRDKIDAAHREGRKSCLILSSVVHEIISQMKATEPYTTSGKCFEQFWDTIRDLGCDYVVIRDMAVERVVALEKTPSLWYSSMFVREDTQDILRAVHFEKVWGSLTERQNALHFLLKVIHPVEDWEKEVAENYLPLASEQYLNMTTVGSGYKLKHFAHTPCAGLQARWQEQFGFHVPDPTHIKLVLKKSW